MDAADGDAAAVAALAQPAHRQAVANLQAHLTEVAKVDRVVRLDLANAKLRVEEVKVRSGGGIACKSLCCRLLQIATAQEARCMP